MRTVKTDVHRGWAARTMAEGLLEVLRVILVAGLLLGGVPVGLVSALWAETNLPGVAVKMERGEVNTIGAASIRIDGKEYAVAPGADIKDSGGSFLKLREIKAGDLVQFHLRKGEIVRVIVQLPM